MRDQPTPETNEAQHEGLLRGNPMPTQVVHVNFARILERERDEAMEALSKLTGTHLSVAISERDDALNQIQGWENKWKAAVDMAAIAENKASNLEDQVDLAMKTIKRLEANQP